MSRYNQVMVSILMVTYNHARFVARAVASVVRQGGSDWELVVLDDCSTDGTQRLLKELRDPRIRVFLRRGRRGIAETYREGIAACRGDCVAFLEGDDEWLEGNLENKLRVLRTHPEVGVVYSNCEAAGEPGVLKAKKPYLRSIMSVPQNRPFNAQEFVTHMNPIPTFSTAVVRRELLLSLKYPSARLQPWLDWFFWNQLSLRCPFFFIPEKTVVWNHHPGSMYSRQRSRGALRTKAVELYLRLKFLHNACTRPVSVSTKAFLAGRFFIGMGRIAKNRVRANN